METKQGKSEAVDMTYEVMADLGNQLVIAKVPLLNIREQDLNARAMKPEMFSQLVSNIKKRGQLESLPLCALVSGIVEVVSGHHRVRAAREAAFESIVVLLDMSGLTRSQIAAKQLAHNAIAGLDDPGMLKQITKLITDVDDLLESYVGKEAVNVPDTALESLLAPKIEFDWRTLTFMFLPYQVDDLDELVRSLAEKPEIVGVAGFEQYELFVMALRQYQKFADVKNVGAAIHLMTQETFKLLHESGYSDDTEWVTLTSTLGGGAVPTETADLIKQALEKITESHEIPPKCKWLALEILAAEYLGVPLNGEETEE